jgi:hypothetical protein
MTTKTPARFGYVCDADTDAKIRRATRAEYRASVRQARRDGGAGIVEDHDGRHVYVCGGSERRQLADELRAAAYDDAETFGREVAQ